MIQQVTTTWMILSAFVGLSVFAFQRPADADALPIDTLPKEREVLFSRDVAPVLQKNCVACHNASNEEGGVNLESVAKMKSSDVEDVLVSGKPEASRLFLLASHADDPVMPPEDNDVSASALNPTELALLRLWIQSGANVDPVTETPKERVWQPLPESLQTVYGAASTADGRLSAVSFGNQIALFGSKSAQPFEKIEIDAGGRIKPAHDDFVQDLTFDATGRYLVSSGYRNVKLWEMAPLESVSIPNFDHDEVLAVAMNASGNHLAILSRQGELSIAEMGEDHWLWGNHFDLPDGLAGVDSPTIHLALGDDGHHAAFSDGNVIRIGHMEAKTPETIDVTDTITSIIWSGNDRLVIGDAKGQVLFCERNRDAWVKKEYKVFGRPVAQLCSVFDDPGQLVAIDEAGGVSTWNRSTDSFDDAGKLPSPVDSASLSLSGTTLWISSDAGILGRYSLTDQKFVEVAKLDPAAEAQWAADSWQTRVGEKLITAQDKEVKQAEANMTAEKTSLEKIAKDMEAKTKLRDEKQTSVDEAKAAAEAATKKLADAKTAEQVKNKQRDELTDSVKRLKTEIEEMESQLAKLKQQRADAEKQLAAIPEAKVLADAVQTAMEAVAQANQVATTKTSELANVVDALRSAEETKTRGESRLNGLNAELRRRQQLLEQVQKEQEQRKAKESESQSLRDQSRATDQTLAVMSAGTRIVTRATDPRDASSGTWSLWSGAGDWLGHLPGIPAGGQLIASGDRGILVKLADGNTLALKSSNRLWHHRMTIGSSTGPSPFADRVLTVDLDSAGNLLATGGGEPSRSGELLIWKVSDGSLVRTIERPHTDTVLCVCFSPDGKILATGSADRMVKLWDVESGNLIKTLEGHTHHVTSIAWNVDRRQLVSGSADATVKIWDIDSGQATRTISGFNTEITRLVYVGRDDRIAVVGGDSYFRVYRTDNGARETNAKVRGGYLYALDSDREGSQFVIGGADGVAAVIDKLGKELLELSSEPE